MTYLASARAQFAYYRHLGGQTLERLSPKQLHAVPHLGGNAVATIVKHLHGNMRSRWTDFLTADGEKPWREREAEFEPDDATHEEVLARWEEGWVTVFAALDALEADGDLERVVYIRAKGHTVTEAINRQLCHYAYHIGQIVLLGRMALGEDWDSLSIPRGGTAAYNEASLGAGQRREHFTEAVLPKDVPATEE